MYLPAVTLFTVILFLSFPVPVAGGIVGGILVVSILAKLVRPKTKDVYTFYHGLGIVEDILDKIAKQLIHPDMGFLISLVLFPFVYCVGVYGGEWLLLKIGEHFEIFLVVVVLIPLIVLIAEKRDHIIPEGPVREAFAKVDRFYLRYFKENVDFLKAASHGGLAEQMWRFHGLYRRGEFAPLSGICQEIPCCDQYAPNTSGCCCCCPPTYNDKLYTTNIPAFYDEIMPQLRTGDIILGAYPRYGADISNFFLHTRWTHAGMIYRPSDCPEVLMSKKRDTEGVISEIDDPSRPLVAEVLELSGAGMCIRDFQSSSLGYVIQKAQLDISTGYVWTAHGAEKWREKLHSGGVDDAPPDEEKATPGVKCAKDDPVADVHWTFIVAANEGKTQEEVTDMMEKDKQIIKQMDRMEPWMYAVRMLQNPDGTPLTRDRKFYEAVQETVELNWENNYKFNQIALGLNLCQCCIPILGGMKIAWCDQKAKQLGGILEQADNEDDKDDKGDLVFCGEFVGHMLQKTGLLDEKLNKNEFAPACFDSSRHLCLRNAKLSQEYVLVGPDSMGEVTDKKKKWYELVVGVKDGEPLEVGAWDTNIDETKPVKVPGQQYMPPAVPAAGDAAKK